MLKVFRSPSTSLVVMALPAEMVVNETIELWQDLHRLVPELRMPIVALNRSAAPTLTDDEQRLLKALVNEVGREGAAGELLQAGLWEADLERATEEAQVRLRYTIGARVISFPRLGALGGFEGGPERLIQQMAAALARTELSEGGA